MYDYEPGQWNWIKMTIDKLDKYHKTLPQDFNSGTPYPGNADRALKLGIDFGNTNIIEKDPLGLNLKEPGAKADAGKSPILQGALQYFTRALLAVATVSMVGAKKYSWKGWESVPDGIARYGNALVRHLAAETTEGETDSDTGQLHASQVAWNALARLELILREKEKQ